MWTLLLCVSLAADSPPDAPIIDSQNLRISSDARQLISTDVSGIRGGQRGGLRALVGYAYRPLVWEEEGGDTVDYVRDLVHVDLTGGWTMGPVRLGAHVPLYYAGGDLGQGVGLGGVGFDLKVSALDGARAPMGLAFNGRIVAPTATLRDVSMRAGGVGWEAGVILDGEVGRALIAGNLGVEGGPRTELGVDQRWGERLSMRLGGIVPVGAAVDLGLEADVAVSLRGSLGRGLGVPAELLPSAVFHTRRGVAVLVGLGAGVSRGVGTPAVRALVGVSWERPAGWGVAATEVAEVPPAVTTQVCEDGSVAEVCPPANVAVRVRFVDATGADLAGVAAELDGAQADGEGRWAVRPGAHRLTARAEGFEVVARELDVPDDVGAWEAVLSMAPSATPGHLGVRVRDPSGRDVTARVLVDGQDQPDAARGLVALPAGEHVVDVVAEGYGRMRVGLVLGSGAEQVLDVTVVPERVRVGAKNIELSERVHFETDSDVILAESWSLLGEVAAVMMAHPEITLVSVDGHTDARGSDSYNLELSRRRAASVVRFLVRLGVAGSRLVSVGYGEALPLSEQTGEAGWALNRRVELRILGRDDGAAPR